MKNNELENLKSQIDERLKVAKNIALVGHKSHDPDAVASQIAMRWYCEKVTKNQHITMILADRKKDGYRFLEGYDDIIFETDIAKVQDEYDLIVLLDLNEYRTFSNYPDLLGEAHEKLVVIDHHPLRNGVDRASIIMRDDSFRSNTLFLYWYFLEEHVSKLPKYVGFNLLIGLFYDTVMLRTIEAGDYKPFKMIPEILEHIDKGLVEVQGYLDGMNDGEFEVIKYMVNHTKKISVGPQYPPITYSYVSNRDIHLFDHNELKIASEKYRVMFLRNLEDSPWGFTVRPGSGNDFILSFRAKRGSYMISEVAKHFGGGGHPGGAGALITDETGTMDSEDICRLVAETIPSLDIPRFV